MNKNRAIFVSLTAALLVLSAGCFSTKTVHQRPWTGGEFVNARRGSTLIAPHGKIVTIPRDVPATYKRGIAVKTLEPETPLAKAGVQEGDLILGVNSEPVANSQTFY